jgi:hypothetical protein
MNKTVHNPMAVEEMVTTPAFHMPDVASTMRDALTRALDYAAQKLRLQDRGAALERMKQGQRNALDYCHYSLAQHVAETLGSLDENVKSVYLYDVDATPEDRAFAELPQGLPIHLLVWVERETSALHSLVAALDRALTQGYAAQIGPRRLAHVLDVQVIDDLDVERRRGLASLLYSMYNRPIALWER